MYRAVTILLRSEKVIAEGFRGSSFFILTFRHIDVGCLIAVSRRGSIFKRLRDKNVKKQRSILTVTAEPPIIGSFQLAVFCFSGRDLGRGRGGILVMVRVSLPF